MYINLTSGENLNVVPAMTVGSACDASGYGSFAGGISASAYEPNSFVWNGDSTRGYSAPHEGTFNVNPSGDDAGFYVGDESLKDKIQRTSYKEVVAITGGSAATTLYASAKTPIYNVTAYTSGTTAWYPTMDYTAGGNYAYEYEMDVYIPSGTDTVVYPDASSITWFTEIPDTLDFTTNGHTIYCSYRINMANSKWFGNCWYVE